MPSCNTCIRPLYSGAIRFYPGLVCSSSLSLNYKQRNSSTSAADSGEPSDAFWLAQAYFLMADYRRVEAILMSTLPTYSMRCSAPVTPVNPEAIGYYGAAVPGSLYPARVTSSCRNTLTQGEGKPAGWNCLCSSAEGGDTDTMVRTHTESNEQGVNSTNVKDQDCMPSGSMVDRSLPCRYLAGLSLVCSSLLLHCPSVSPRKQLHQERLADALSLIGETNPFAATGK